MNYSSDLLKFWHSHLWRRTKGGTLCVLVYYAKVRDTTGVEKLPFYTFFFWVISQELFIWFARILTFSSTAKSKNVDYKLWCIYSSHWVRDITGLENLPFKTFSIISQELLIRSTRILTSIEAEFNLTPN